MLEKYEKEYRKFHEIHDFTKIKHNYIGYEIYQKNMGDFKFQIRYSEKHMIRKKIENGKEVDYCMFSEKYANRESKEILSYIGFSLVLF